MNSYVFTDEEYGKVLDNIVVGCVDVVIVHNNQVLLEKRQFNPIQDEWWIFGGRIKVGESLKETAQRSVARELGLQIMDPDRFIEIGTFNLRWPTRREPVSENGCHHLLIAHMVQIDDTERQLVDSTVAERSEETSWFDINNNTESFLPEMENIISAAKRVISSV